MYLIAIRARVAQPNTPETDLLPEVNHIVNYTTSDGRAGVIIIMAKEPGDALKKAEKLTMADIGYDT